MLVYKHELETSGALGWLVIDGSTVPAATRHKDDTQGQHCAGRR